MAAHSPIAVSPPSRQVVILCSSSPDLPSLDSLLRRKPLNPLRNGSRAAPIPTGAVSGFQSARLLQRDAVDDDEANDTARHSDKPRKRRKKHEEDQGVTKPARKKERTPPSTKPDVGRGSPKLGRYVFEATEGIEESPEYTAQTRATQGGMTATKPPTGGNEVSLEPVGLPKAAKTASRKTQQPAPTSEDVSHLEHFDPQERVESPCPSPDGQRTNKNVSRLEVPVTTKAFREPVITTFKKPTASVATDKIVLQEETPLLQTTVAAPASRPDIDFQAAWSYTGSGSKQDDSLKPVFADNFVPAEDLKPAKTSPQKRAKPPAKSYRTVTNVAIARYQDTTDERDDLCLASFWDQSETAQAKKLLEPGSTASSKRKGRTSKTSKKLLEPEAAQARVERQEFFFGTSSQLMRDEPAEQVKDLQKALKASQCDDAGVLGSGEDDGPPRLWASGIRAADSSLLEAERTSKRIRTYSPRKSKFIAEDNISDTSKKPRLKPAPSSSKAVLRSLSMNLVNSSASPTKLSLSKGTARSYATVTAATEDAETMPKKKRGRPRKDASDTSSSTKAAVKTCGDDASNVTASSSPSKISKRTSRKQKPEDKDTAHPRGVAEEVPSIDDIEEAEADGADSAKRRKSKVSQKKKREEFVANKACALFPAITKVIKAQKPEPGEPTVLTWYEKMLLYDPIVLEDLTAWLKESSPQEDEEGFMPVAELEPWMVQLWCEEHSICCLWREGLRGGVKLRY